MKKSETRQALEMAIKRIRRGVTKVVPPGQRMSIAAVAREAGVSNATIHNRHPDIADMVRQLIGEVEPAKMDIERNRLKECQMKLAELRKEHAQLKIDLQRSQSINLRLLKENELLRKNSTHEANVFALRK
ncbi:MULTISPECIES: TetR family transcriptional regulator [Burkholderiaceae]|uniref:TetR family transcriptional regulator-like protein n=1 Tax=Paraburkholderia phytofirmans (strain DSM 17436 / LMG 22146 / PsJN) TaxID=398527 RepID=B2TH97_PARPJ|nr:MULTISPECIES: TetR family transcriptional regulator [Burkholderiaceae]ACD21646.1 TetR family transcriptional regulator-like protein [Paraburkholderia phytofirmans PsJN]HDR8965284.1 TetR family transcriptional regulator [Burkholderia vietnamiensis]HDR8968447.1 TetR family transcriptional regulator [Burkholderia vietnamiensis]